MPSLKDNISAVTEAIGMKSVGLVWGLANVDWVDQKERDQFLSELTAGNQKMEG
tara:strand:- start:406 stop:567 length:162 start_codon:yes stop_codon:yes gene_type:complete